MEGEFVYKPIGERVAVLETKAEDVADKLEAIKEKLDELLTIKAKGMGALGLVALLIGSGALGIIAACMQFFSHPHL